MRFHAPSVLDRPYGERRRLCGFVRPEPPFLRPETAQMLPDSCAQKAPTSTWNASTRALKMHPPTVLLECRDMSVHSNSMPL